MWASPDVNMGVGLASKGQAFHSVFSSYTHLIPELYSPAYFILLKERPTVYELQVIVYTLYVMIDVCTPVERSWTKDDLKALKLTYSAIINSN